jgi:hypothetical protein
MGAGGGGTDPGVVCSLRKRAQPVRVPRMQARMNILHIILLDFLNIFGNVSLDWKQTEKSGSLMFHG